MGLSIISHKPQNNKLPENYNLTLRLRKVVKRRKGENAKIGKI